MCDRRRLPQRCCVRAVGTLRLNSGLQNGGVGCEAWECETWRAGRWKRARKYVEARRVGGTSPYDLALPHRRRHKAMGRSRAALSHPTGSNIRRCALSCTAVRSVTHITLFPSEMKRLMLRSEYWNILRQHLQRASVDHSQSNTSALSQHAPDVASPHSQLYCITTSRGAVCCVPA